jgi:sugar/nucleoside kinase (ribokinase family)
VQYIHHVATDLFPVHMPEAWQRAPVVHIGPVAQEAKAFVNGRAVGGILGLTPQGWMRAWDANGRIHPVSWNEAPGMLPHAGAVVISVEDVGCDEDQIENMVSITRVLAVTEGPAGARLYWNGDLRRFHAPEKDEVDATGAGDIFAAAFFWRLYATRDPWAAAHFATHLASFSVTRRGLDSIPTRQEIQASLVEVL